MDAVKAYPACAQVISGRYRDNGHNALFSRNAIGCSIMFQYSRKPSTIADSRPLLPSGRPSFQKIRHSPAPSIRAASKSCTGIQRNPPYVRNTGNVENTAGKITAAGVSSIPSRFKTR